MLKQELFQYGIERGVSGLQEVSRYYVPMEHLKNPLKSIQIQD